MSTYMAKPDTIEHGWYILDAADKPLGPPAARRAYPAWQAQKPNTPPNQDCGDYVIVINVEKSNPDRTQDGAEVLTGRRKSSVARVHLFPNGTGSITINGRPLDDYFGLETLKLIVRQPFAATDTMGKFDVEATVTGGGVTGQAGAIRHGIARALLQVEDSYRAPLKAAGLLTRDPRMKERKKYGLAMLDRMEALGLVKREHDAKDRRRVTVSLTEKARGLQEQYDAVSNEVNAIFYDGFSGRRCENLRRTLCGF